MNKSCRNCNLYLPEMNRCLIAGGFFGIEKMKDSNSYHNCVDFSELKLIVKQTQTKAG